MTITRYVLVDRDNVEGDHEYDRYDEAVADAQKYDSAVIEREYVYDDSSLVWTPDGRDRWPPKQATRTR